VNDKIGGQPPKTEPRFFYGYIVVVATFFIMMMSWGLFMVFGVFFKPLLTDFGWTSTMTSGIFSLSIIIYGMLGIVMGGLNDRFGPRIVVTLSGFILGLGYLLMSQVSTLWQIYLFFGVIIGIGMSGTWVPPLSTVAKWFVKRRNLMSGIVIAGAGIGGLIGPLVISRLIVVYGWRLSYIILGGVILLVMVLAAQFLRRHPTQMGQLPYGENEGKQQVLKSETRTFPLRGAVCTAQFWIVFIMFFCFGFCMFAITVHIVPHVIELEISAISAANILAINMGISILGNFVLGGVIGDRLGNRHVFIIGFILMSAALFWLVWARELWTLYLFALVFGFAHGGMATSESPLVAWLFGLSSHGLILGVAGVGFTIGSAVGPVVIGHIFDLTHSYQTAFLVCAAIGIAGLILAVVLRPTKRRGIKI
jgi:MFS family permease